MTQHLSSSQLRAARALLNWSRAELAQQTDVSEQTIHRMENNLGEPEVRTQQKLTQALERVGVEFIEHEGVRFRPEGVEVLNGKQGMGKFWDLVFYSAQTTGGKIRQSGIAEAWWSDSAPEVSLLHRKRMARLVAEKKDIQVRAILREGDYNFPCTDYADYRWYPREAPPPVPHYIFGDSVAIFAFESDPSPKIVLITSPVIATAYSLQFDQTWEAATIPPQLRTRVNYK